LINNALSSTSAIFTKVRHIFFITFIVLSVTTRAQYYNGLSTANFAGNIAIQHNPANLADSRFKFDMNVAGINAHLQHNYLNDADNDKEADNLDKYPDAPCKKRTNGCHDKGEYDVADVDYACPDVYVNSKSEGSPDSDGDGVQYGVDQCPDIAGEKQFNGCVKEQ
jgi:hypothetical protein